MKFRSHYSSSGGNFYTVSQGTSVLALEAGIPMTKIRRALDGLISIAHLDGCLVTHYHGDHACVVAGMMGASVTVYASQETLTRVRVTGHRAVPIRTKEPISVGPWRVLPFDVRHDAEGSLGFLIQSSTEEKLLFVLDTAFIPYRFRRVNVIAVECNFADDLLRESSSFQQRRARRYHMSLGRVLEFLEDADLSATREIHLLHVSDSHGDPARFQREVEAATGIPTYVAPKGRP